MCVQVAAETSLTPRRAMSAVATIHTVEERDDAEFVKVFAAGVQAMYGLTKTGMRVFQAILDEYQNTSMAGGFADSVYLHWFGNGLNGRVLDMGDVRFTPASRSRCSIAFWPPARQTCTGVNSALFFKGDRGQIHHRVPQKGVVLEASVTQNPRLGGWQG